MRSEVDFVLTFEEMAGIFDAKHVDIENIAEDEGGVNAASRDGRNFAVAGGVAKSVVDVIAQNCIPDKEIRVANAEGLKECKKAFTACQGRKVQRIPVGRNGMPGRLCGRCRNNAAGEEIPDGSLLICRESRSCDQRQDGVCE